MKSDAYKISKFPDLQRKFEKLGYKLTARLDGDFQIDNLEGGLKAFLNSFDEVTGYLYAVQERDVNDKNRKCA